MKNENELLEFLKKCSDEKKYNLGLKAINDNFYLIEKKYYEIIRYKLDFLTLLGKYIDALILIKEELNVPYVPSDFEKHLLETQKNINFQLRSINHSELSFEDLENIDKLSGEELLEIVPHLKEFNLNQLVLKFQNIFKNNEISNLIKSLLIAALSDCQLDYSFFVEKEKTMIKFNPKTVFDIREGENYKFLSSEISKISNCEINALELINRLVVLYLLDLYPLVISEEYCQMILAAAIYLTSQMLNCTINSKKYSEIYASHLENMSKIIEKMNILLETI